MYIDIVQSSFHVKNCGSCWAFVTTTVVASSVIRNEAFSVYNREIKKILSNVTNATAENPDLRLARKIATEAERKAFHRGKLSIQQLIDCDTQDLGCSGGNPLLAYFYIRDHGLVANDHYPYDYLLGTCQVARIQNPIAKVKSWGILPENDEDTLELVLRYIGPVTVKLYGSDKSFTHYRAGIFRDTECGAGKAPNHSMVMVGYGEQHLEDGSKVRIH